MKRLMLILALAAGLFAAPACNSKKSDRADEKNVITTDDVPSLVQKAFTAKYPGAAEVIWEDAHEADESTYKVKFKKDNKYWKAEFRPDGSLVKEKEDE